MHSEHSWVWLSTGSTEVCTSVRVSFCYHIPLLTPFYSLPFSLLFCDLRGGSPWTAWLDSLPQALARFGKQGAQTWDRTEGKHIEVFFLLPPFSERLRSSMTTAPTGWYLPSSTGQVPQDSISFPCSPQACRWQGLPAMLISGCLKLPYLFP